MNTETTLENDKKALRILHYAFCFGSLCIILLMHFFIHPISFSNAKLDSSIFTLIPLFIAGTNLVLSNVLFNNKIKEAGTKVLNNENKENIRTAYVLKWALLEGAVLINAMLYFLINHNSILIIVALLLLMLLYLSKPKFS